MINTVRISEKDNVAVVIEWVKKGEQIEFSDSDGRNIKIEAKDDIRIYHKVAIKDIKKGENVIKYGEDIGIASSDIAAGEHAHNHNVEDNRENLREKE